MSKTIAADAGNNPISVKETNIKKEEPRYPVDAMRKNSMKLFGVTTSTFDGAFYRQDKTKNYSVREAIAILEKWLKKEVEN